MSETRTVTGSYIVRPHKQSTYLTGGTFTNYFTTSEGTYTAGEPGNGWNRNLNVTEGVLSDGNDSTKVTIALPGKTITTMKHDGYNSILVGKVDDEADVPEWDYKITNVKGVVRWGSNHNFDSTWRQSRIWTSFWRGGSYPKSADFSLMWGQNGRFTNKAADYTHSKTYNYSVPAGEYPKSIALCMSGCRAFNYSAQDVYCYDIRYEVDFSYEETAETVNFFTDSGVVVTTGGTEVPTGVYETWRHTKFDLVANVKPGYIIDGWYLNGQKVSESLTYTYELYDADRLYCITKKRKIFVGDYQVDEVYIGNQPATAVYDGNECIWGESELKAAATAENVG